MTHSILQETIQAQDTYYMQQALRQAKRAFDKDEVPVGAVVVDQTGKIISRAYNKVEQSKSQVAHAEILALTKAGKKTGNWRLENMTLYVTLEPCALCMHLILNARIKCVVYSVSSPLFGYRLDKCGAFSLYNSSIEIRQRVCAEESSTLLKTFFQKKRKKRL